MPVHYIVSETTFRLRKTKPSLTHEGLNTRGQMRTLESSLLRTPHNVSVLPMQEYVQSVPESEPDFWG